MLQFILSKITVSILSLSLVALAIGYFVFFNQSAYETQASEIANLVASRIDEIGSQNMVMRVLFSYNHTGSVDLPPKIGGEFYSLEIGGSVVIISMKNYAYASHLHVKIYTFDPAILQGKKVTSEMLYNYSLQYPYIKSNLQWFYVENKYMLVDGLYKYVTFAYLRPP